MGSTADISRCARCGGMHSPTVSCQGTTGPISHPPLQQDAQADPLIVEIAALRDRLREAEAARTEAEGLLESEEREVRRKLREAEERATTTETMLVKAEAKLAEVERERDALLGAVDRFNAGDWSAADVILFAKRRAARARADSIRGGGDG